MRRTVTYRKAKLRLIHKLKGLDLIADSFDKVYDESASERHWFKGYHVFSSRQEVINRLQMGKPLRLRAWHEVTEIIELHRL